MELDSHADTVVLGNNCLVLNYTNRECDVAPYTDTYQAISNVPIVTGATAYTSPTTGDTFILVFHEALWMGPHLDHSLINPNQLRNYGLTVQDNPFSSTETHIATEDNAFILPLFTMGTTLYFDSHTPTDHELHTCQHIHFTSSTPWDPHHIQFPPPSHRVEISAMRTNDAAQHDEDERIVSLAPPDFAERLISRVFIDDVRVGKCDK
jgi:hypothetical protein